MAACCSHKIKWYWCTGVLLGIAIVILVFGIAGPFLLESKIQTEVLKQTTMTADNYEFWVGKYH